VTLLSQDSQFEQDVAYSYPRKSMISIKPLYTE